MRRKGERKRYEGFIMEVEGIGIVQSEESREESEEREWGLYTCICIYIVL